MATNFTDNSNFSEEYENLPGFKVNYQDGNLAIGATSVGSNTKSLLIIGTAIDGPIGDPVSVNALGGPTAAEKVFGKMTKRVRITEGGKTKTIRKPHGGSLIRSMWEAYYMGCEDIRLMRVTGRRAKSEIALKNPNSEIFQSLMDSKGDNLIQGNDAFDVALGLGKDERLVSVLKVDELEPTSVVPVKTFNGSEGYESVDNSAGSETISFPKNKFKPGNTIQISYQIKKRTYTDVAHTEDGVIDTTSTKGLLTQDSTNDHYFKSEKANWSDDPTHTINLYVTDASGSTSTISAINAAGEKLYRIGEQDPAINDELTDAQTSLEFQQGGIRFTSAYDAEVANGLYPDVTAAGVRVTVDYKYYSDVDSVLTKTENITGSDKVTILQGTPIGSSLNVYYEVAGVKTDLVAGTDYTTTISVDPTIPSTVVIAPGVGPVGARLFATYKTSAKTVEGASLVIEAANAGSLYGGFLDENDTSSLDGVHFVVEYAKQEDGTVDLQNRVIRFIKPDSKKNSQRDLELRYETAKLAGITTVKEFVNFVNTDANNNIVQLSVDAKYASIPVIGLQATDFEVDSFTKEYTYREICLGEQYDEAAGHYALYEDLTADSNIVNRFPWTGADGFFNNSDMVANKEFYDILGGRYEVVTAGEDPILVEQGMYGLIENYAVDQITLVDVYANSAIAKLDDDGEYVLDTNRSFAQQLAQHCAMATAKTWETIGFIGMAPVYQGTLRKVQEYIDLATGVTDIQYYPELVTEFLGRGINPYFTNKNYMYNPANGDLIYNDSHEPIDIGFYINNVFGPEAGFTLNDIGSYVASAANSYAGLVTTLEPQNSTTNHQFDVLGLRYTLSESQHNQLAGAGYVTFEARINSNGSKTYKVKDGTTASLKTSDYNRLSTVRITHYVVQQIRNVADKYIGLPNGLAQRNSLATEIQAALDNIRDAGIVNDFKFEMYSSVRDQVMGNVFITLELVPAFEMRRILTTVALRPSL